jgi:hypothetical protein
MCNDSVPDIVKMIMTECYDEWDAAPYAPWAVIYYDMGCKKHRFINGPVLKVSEESLGFHYEDVSLTGEVQKKSNLARSTPSFPP